MSEQWIDVSAHNGVIGWPRVAAFGVRGVIIRAGYGNDISQKDTRFTVNIKGAIAAGLKIGVYWFSYADSVADARKEWAVCKQIIAPYKKHILFVAYDYEYDSVGYYRRIHGAAPSNALINSMVNAFLDAASTDGYGTVLYTNNDYRLHVFTAATLAAWDIWLADYSGAPDINCAIRQTGSTGRVDGIGGNVDMDTVFKAYGAVRPSYTCDTSNGADNPVIIPMGGCYTAKTTGNVQLVAGKSPTSARVQIVRCIQHGYILWHIVPFGDPGQSVGIYAEGGPLLFVCKIE